ncbi:DUF6233 domain-containing protein [Streptomyces caelestis]|uniref:DUF6233 domain-containing protein n=1 Tax=Streptomyces caelestis TaxID=36816 RepID=UPI00381A3563
MERGLTRDSTPVHVHVGDCWNAGKRSRGASRITDAMDECARLVTQPKLPAGRARSRSPRTRRATGVPP